MNQISEENYSLNNIKNDMEANNQKIYSKTSPINNSQENPQINTKDYIVHHFYPGSVEKNTKYKNIINNNINKPITTNNDTTLVKNLEVLDNDNNKLREALSELNLELKEKEKEINESQKILRKINEEYTQLIKEFKKLEEQKNLYQQENDKNKKMLDNMNKKFNDYDKIMKQNEQLKNELIKNKEIMNNLKGNYTNVSNGFNIIEKDRKDKEIIIKDLKIEGNKIINMLKDRELLIEEYSKKVAELNQIIKEKDEKLKLMINLSKELNTENKINIKELTKQAVKTIKVFYNYMNNKDNSTQVNFVEIIRSDNDKNINKNNIYEIIFGNNNNKNNDKKNKCSFLLNEALENVLYIPDIGINYINKEFLIDNNFKTCLLKTELFSCIIREFELYSFLENKFSKLNDAISKLNFYLPTQLKDGEIKKNKKLGDYGKNFGNIKIMLDKINKNANKYKKENISLKAKLKELILYINKLKKEFNDKIKKFKEKFKIIDNKYNIYISKLEENKNNINKPNNKEENIVDDRKKEIISNLYQEIDKIKNMNQNMQQNIIEKDDIINKLKNENDQLLNKLNAFRTNPNAVNNCKFYNSFSLANNNNTQKENMNNINLSNISNYHNKYNTNKYSNSNEYIFDINLKDNLSNTSMKYSTKATTKSNKKRNIRNIIKNINEYTYNTFNENDITNKFIKSFRNNFNFYGLKIVNQEQFNYISYNKLNNINIEKSKSTKKIYSINPNITDDENNCTVNFQNSSKMFQKELINNINNFKSELKEDIFRDLINKSFGIGKIIQLLSNKIEEIKNNLSNIKEKFKNNHKNKKIKPLQLIDILEQIEKLLLYVNNHLNKTNNDMQNIQPFLNNVFNLVFKIAYNSPLSTYNNSCDITPITIGVNTLQNSVINNNNSKKNNKDNAIKNNNSNNINKIFDNNKIINQEIEDINNNIINNSTRTKESILPNIQELKQFFDINKKIFSSSELIKYKTIYEGLPISKLLHVFKDICDNLKKTVFNSKNEYDSDISDFEDSNTIEETKTSQIITENITYHVVNQKIFGLKKFQFNYKIFMELLKNYLVTFEIIVNQIKIEINNKHREKIIKLGEELNILYNIFEDAVYFKMDILDDDIIFNRKILLKLLLNHKEYLSIIYDI